MIDDIEARLSAYDGAMRERQQGRIERLPEDPLSGQTPGRRFRIRGAWGTAAALACVCLVFVSALLVSVHLTGSASGSVGQGPSEPVPSTTAVDPSRAAADDLVLSPNGRVLVRRGNLLLTSDSTLTTWHTIKLPSGINAELAVTPEDGVAVVLSHSSQGTPVAMRTVDGGASWTRQDLPGRAATKVVGIPFVDQNTGFIALSDEASSTTVLTTDDGGATWTRIASPPLVADVVSATNSTTLWAAASGDGTNQLTMMVSNIASQTWGSPRIDWGGTPVDQFARVISAPQPTSQGQAVAVMQAPSDQGTRMHFLRTSDEGRSWTDALAPQIPSGEVDSAAILDANHWLVAVPGSSFHLYSTNDSGAHWTDLHPAGLSPAWWFRSFAFMDSRRGIALAGVGPDANAILITFDGGRSWSPVDFGMNLPPLETSPTK